MKYKILAAVAALAFVAPAYAQQSNVVPLKPGQAPWTPTADARTFDAINCSLLKGAPSVCVINETDKQVTDIDCESKGFWGGNKVKTINLPKGGVAPHSVTIVNMGSCQTTLVFTLPGGKERRLGPVNTDNMTTVDVPQQ